MSFAANIKGELSRLPLNRGCCVNAELAALVLINGNLYISGSQVQLNIVTEHAAIARRLYSMVKMEFGTAPRILVRKKVRLRKNLTYLAQIDDYLPIVTKLGILDAQGRLHASPDGMVTARQCCRRAYLRGCFLAGGSVSNPESSGYHLEIATEYAMQAEYIQALITREKLKCGIIERKHQHVVYLKDAGQIAELLTTIGTNQGRLILENVRIVKEIRNSVNRLVNCETANLNKTINAAQRQLAAIRKLERTIGLDQLSPGLRQMARLRLADPEATLGELGEAASPHLSKSAVNYRLRKLVQLAEYKTT